MTLRSLHIREALKADKTALLRKPWYIFYLPGLAFSALRNRLYSPADRLYLTETAIAACGPLINRPLPEDCGFSLVQSAEGFEPLARRRMEEDEVGPSYLREAAARFGQGDYVLLLAENGRPAAFVFISESRADFRQAHTRLALPPGCFACYDTYAFADRRGKGLYTSLMAQTFRHMQAKGFHTMWLWVMAHNQLSVKVHFALGIGRVVKVVSERYRGGFRIRRVEEVDFSLAELIDGRQGRLLHA